MPIKQGCLRTHVYHVDYQSAIDKRYVWPASRLWSAMNKADSGIGRVRRRMGVECASGVVGNPVIGRRGRRGFVAPSLRLSPKYITPDHKHAPLPSRICGGLRPYAHAGDGALGKLLRHVASGWPSPHPWLNTRLSALGLCQLDSGEHSRGPDKNSGRLGISLASLLRHGLDSGIN